MLKPAITIHAGDFKAGSQGRFVHGKFVLPVPRRSTRRYSLEQTRIYLADLPDLVGHYVPGIAHLVLPAGEGALVLGRMETLFIARFDDGKDLLASMDTATFNHAGLNSRVVPPTFGSAEREALRRLFAAGDDGLVIDDDGVVMDGGEGADF